MLGADGKCLCLRARAATFLFLFFLFFFLCFYFFTRPAGSRSSRWMLLLQSAEQLQPGDFETKWSERGVDETFPTCLWPS